MIVAKEDKSRKLDFSKIDKIVDGDIEYRIELLALTLRFFSDMKQNFKNYLIERQTDKLKYLAHKAKPSLSLFDSNIVSQLLNDANALLAHPPNLHQANVLVQAMEAECDFFIREITQQLN
ncbi:MAG: hypothetical protein MUE85_16075 [Microscillaceae bacterium]|jgi:hypothetical protein|nr:hypothetical protein [Microscillaceae bacterium]